MAYWNAGRPHTPLARTAAVFALLLLTVALAVTTARAASLGKLHVVSHLGQPLHARIDVSAARNRELDTMAARLASGDAYRQAGLSYAPALQALRLELTRLKGGKYCVEVRSTQPLHEPVIDLLVELAWSEGTRSYAYTALIDPIGSPTSASGVEPLAKYATVHAAGHASKAERSTRPGRSTVAVAAPGMNRGPSIADQIRQKEERLATYKHQLAAAQERITELQWTAQEQERLLTAIVADAIARDMRAASAPDSVRASHVPAQAAVAASSAGIVEAMEEPAVIGGGMAALLLATLVLMRRRRYKPDVEEHRPSEKTIFRSRLHITSPHVPVGEPSLQASA